MHMTVNSIVLNIQFLHTQDRDEMNIGEYCTHGRILHVFSLGWGLALRYIARRTTNVSWVEGGKKGIYF